MVARALAWRVGAEGGDRGRRARRRISWIRDHQYSGLSRPTGRSAELLGFGTRQRAGQRGKAAVARWHYAAGQQGQHPRHPLLPAQRFWACRRGRQSDLGKAGVEDAVEGVTTVVIARSEATKQSSFFNFRKESWLLRGACHRARIRATRWLAMTKQGAVRQTSNPLELQPCQPCIKPACGDQLGVGALLDDAALVHHHDPV